MTDTPVGQMTLAEVAKLHSVGERFEYGGQIYKLAKNGSIIDCGTSKIVYGVPPASTRINTSERGRELAFQRWHAPRQEAVLRAVRDALQTAEKKDTDVMELIPDYLAADSYLFYALTREGILDTSARLRDRVAAHRHVLEQVGADAKPEKGENSPKNGASVTLNLSQDALETLAAALLSARNNSGQV